MPQPHPMEDHLLETLRSGIRKLKVGMDTGPFGDDVTLNPGEATLIYRILVEEMGIKV